MRKKSFIRSLFELQSISNNFEVNFSSVLESALVQFTIFEYDFEFFESSSVFSAISGSFTEAGAELKIDT